MSLEDEMEAELGQLSARSLLRDTHSWSGSNRLRPLTDEGKELLSFCSNDYLGLANHPALLGAAAEATRHYGFGAGASRLITGESPSHRSLERSLAIFLGCGDALLFPTGYQTNVGVLTALAGPDDLIVSDSANHASIIDGCRLSRARVSVYPHGDAARAYAALTTPGPFRRRILVTESLFSMDGDRAPLAELAEATRRTEALLIVDEAHALGVVGPQGRGVCAEAGIHAQVVIGTLGKAFGAHGGFAAGSDTLRAFLINKARQFIYSTACPPSVAAAAQAGLLLSLAPEGQDRRARALANASQVRAQLRARGFPVPGQDLILPVIVGSEDNALSLSSALLRYDILVPAIRPPTVPPGTSRLRVTISAEHSSSDIHRLIEAFSSSVQHLAGG